jgi:hypothetical protein
MLVALGLDRYGVTTRLQRQYRYLDWYLIEDHWYLIEDDGWRGKWLIAYLDDASRFRVGYCIFDEATTENAIDLLRN